MLRASSAWLLIALAAYAAGCAAKAPATSAAAAPVVPFDCSGEVCGFNVVAASLVTAPCEGRSVLVAYSRTNGTALVQCADPGRTQDNLVYLFDRRSTTGPVYELDGARYVTGAFLAQAAAEGIPDRFGSVPLCVAPGAAAAGELTLVVKEPNAGSGSPYCYRLYRASQQAGMLRVVAEGAAPPAPSTDGRSRWTSLASQLLPHMQSAAVADAGSAATVATAKARLYGRPEPSATTRMYLVKGDTVTLLLADNGGGWSRIRYTGKSGKAIERWIRTSDLAK
jgi:hypothetical protein